MQAVTVATGKAGISHFAQQLIAGKLPTWLARMPHQGKGS